MNQTRQQQILSLIKRIVSVELQELNHEYFHHVVVTDALLNNDGRECRIWVDADDAKIRALNTTYRQQIQHAFMKKYARKIVPQLVFMKDTGELDVMDKLFDTIEKE